MESKRSNTKSSTSSSVLPQIGNQQEVATYVPLGTRNADRTEYAYKIAIHQFELFLSSKGIEESFENLKEETLCNI
jgi:hypothetical protein